MLGIPPEPGEPGGLHPVSTARWDGGGQVLRAFVGV